MGTIDVVLTDFERTLVRLFEDGAVEQEFFEEVWSRYALQRVPFTVRTAAEGSPYTLWTSAHRWMTAHVDAAHAEAVSHDVGELATKYELAAATSVRLLDDVADVLERLQTASIPVVVVSNNSTEAVTRTLEERGVGHLVAHVVGREPHFLLENLKPSAFLLERALELSARDASTAVLVGDSVDDMEAGGAAGVYLRVGLLDHSTVTEQALRDAGANLVLPGFKDLPQVVPGG